IERGTLRVTHVSVTAPGSPACLVCHSTETEAVFRSPVSVTSDTKGRDREVVNTLCTRCGHLFNATVSASGLAEFYLDEYDLHSESAYSEFQYLIDGRRVGANDLWLDFLMASAPFGETGRMLE